MGTPNSVGWMFTTKGITRIPLSAVADLESFTLEGIDYGIEDVATEEDQIILTSAPEALHTIHAWLTGQDISLLSSGPELIPNSTTTPTPTEQEQLHQLFEELDDHPDVTALTSNEAE
jgi:transcriptional/translational regulatory protein YebC/TACO1